MPHRLRQRGLFCAEASRPPAGRAARARHQRLVGAHGFHGRRPRGLRRRGYARRQAVPILREDVWQLTSHLREGQDRLERYAELAVRVGANLEEGQTVLINARSSMHRSRVRSRARRTRPARGTSTSLPRPARAQGDDRVRPDEALELHAGVAEDARRGAQRTPLDLDDRRSRAASCWPTSTASASGARDA